MFVVAFGNHNTSEDNGIIKARVTNKKGKTTMEKK